MKLLLDIKFAIRLMLKNPGFSLLTIAVMTIGLGICMYNYSFIHGFMLKDLPFENGARMYSINTVQNGIEYNGGTVFIPDYLEMRDELTGLDQIGAYSFNTVNISGSGRSVRYPAIYTEAGVFDYTGIPAFMGRVLNEQDNIPGANPVVVISYHVWENFFGGRGDIVGNNMEIEGKFHEIVGVMPNGYKFPTSIDLWVPMQVDYSKEIRNSGPRVEIFLLTSPGVSIDSINQQINTIMARLGQEFPETNSGRGAMAKTYKMSNVGNGGYMIMTVLLTSVMFILVLACTNVGNLLLARANERSKETAVRVALGAPRWRLVTQMMWESFIICAISGVFSILIAGWGLEISYQLMTEIINGPMPFYWEISLDSHIVFVALGMVVATSILTGLVPALKMSSGDFNSVLRDGTRGAQGRKAGKMSSVLVTMEIALSCCLLTVAAVLAISAEIVTKADYGVDYQNKYLASIELTEHQYPEELQQAQFYQELVRKLEERPEIARASLASTTPGQYTGFTSIFVEGMDVVQDSEYPRTNAANFMPGFMELVGIQPLAGRLLDHRDDRNATPVAVVTDSFAMQHFGSIENALDKRFYYVMDEDKVWYTIVGVVPHIIYGQPYSGLKDRPAVMTSSLQDTHSFMDIVATPSGTMDAEDLSPIVQNVLFEMDPQVAAFGESRYDSVIRRNTGGMRFIADIFKLMAVAAVMLAASGIYGVMANSIERRTHEFGVRRALGATDESVVLMVLKKGFWQLLIGSAIGAPLAWLLGNQMVTQFGAESVWLNVMYVAMPLLIAFIVMLSTWLPARKAVQFEPSAALRYE